MPAQHAELQIARRCIRRLVITTVVAVVTAAYPAAHSNAQAKDPDAKLDASETVEKVHTGLSKYVQQTAYSVDRFFATDTFTTWEDNKTNIRLRANLDFIEHIGWDFDPEFKLHIVLPGLKGRLRLVSNDDDEEGPDDRLASDFTDETSVALRYIGVQGPKWGASFDLGVRIKDDNLSVYPRVNVRRRYGLGTRWAGGTEARLFYYGDTGGRVDARQFFERRLS